MLNIDQVRSEFPALSNNEDWALFDNAGSSVPLGTVVDAAADYMRRYQVQLGASYEISARASEMVKAGHDALAAYVNAEPGEVVLGPSTTVNMHHLARALRPLWKEGDEVVVTNLDHETNVAPWRGLEATGIVIREWKFRPETMALEIEDLEPLLNERTRLVAFTHCSNIVGGIHDVAAISRRIHKAGALSCVDGVAFAPHRQIDVKAWDVDFYGLSLYKTYGPHLGLLYGKRDLLLQGHSQYHFFIGEDEVPYKYEPGNVNHELAASLPEIPAYFERLGGLEKAFAEIRTHEENLARPLIDYLGSRSDVRLMGPATADGDVRVPTIAFVVEGRKSSEIPPLLDAEKLAVRWGHFYAYRPIRDLGLLEQDGVVRVSAVHYNRVEEMERLVAALDRVL